MRDLGWDPHDDRETVEGGLDREGRLREVLDFDEARPRPDRRSDESAGDQDQELMSRLEHLGKIAPMNIEGSPGLIG